MEAIFLIEYTSGESLSTLIKKLKDKTKFFAKRLSDSLHCQPLKKMYDNSYIFQGRIYLPITANLFFLSKKLYIDFSPYYNLYSEEHKMLGRIIISDEEINHCVLSALAGLKYSIFLVKQITYADIANNTIRDFTDKVKIISAPTQKAIIKTERPPLKQGIFILYGTVDGKHIYGSLSKELETCPGTYSQFQTFSREIIHQLIYPGITITEINGLFYLTYKNYPELLAPFLKVYIMEMKIPSIKGLHYDYIPYSFHHIGKKEGIVEQNYKIKILKPCSSYEEANEVAETIKAKIALSLFM